MRISIVLAAAWLGLVIGCGGKLEGGADRDPGAGGSGQEDDSGSAGGESNPWAPQPTGKCRGGWDPNDAPDGQTCEWLAEGKCYETKDGACACICPSGGDSVCWSSWSVSDDSRTEVKCELVD